MNQQPPTHPQHGPALALLALIAAHPDLPPVTWTVSPGGDLSGSTYTRDAVAAFTAVAYVDALGGKLLPVTYRSATGVPMCVLTLDVVWQDVRLRLRCGCPAAMLPGIAEQATPANSRRRHAAVTS